MSDLAIKKLNEISAELKAHQNDTPEVKMLNTTVDEIHQMNEHRQKMRYANAALMGLILAAFLCYALIVRQGDLISNFVGFVVIFMGGLLAFKYMDYMDNTKIMDTFMHLSKSYRAKKVEPVQPQDKHVDEANVKPKYL
ncbi:unnamed protein product [Oppiella nova]|uniref:Uncharacterized protein n=1 Tax=Oppiella nova TaxID=334625 RepID=A0A7R9LVR6_9ACAR|nr:unnamed protein product [Oppiella nova]CAG2167399.1 unnamed protein product [Oppiella nova]